MRRALASLVMVGALAGLGLMAVPAQADPPLAGGSISGHVTDDQGRPLEGLCVFASHVNAFAVVGPGVFPLGWEVVRTDAGGTYTLTGLKGGEYYVIFRSCTSLTGAPEEWQVQYYDDAPDIKSAEFVLVVEGFERSGIDAQMQPNPQYGAPTCRYPSEVPVQHDSSKEITLTCSDPDPGDTLTYLIKKAPRHGSVSEPDGSGRVTYRPAAGYVGPDGFTFRATDTRGKVSKVAAVELNVGTLADPTGETISGHVSDYQGNPLAGITVKAVRHYAKYVYNYQENTYCPGQQPSFDAVTDASGNYTMHVLPGQQNPLCNGVVTDPPFTIWMTVGFSDPAGQWVGEWYDSHPEEASAKVVPVHPGLKEEGINASLEPVNGVGSNSVPTCEDRSSAMAEYDTAADLPLRCSDADSGDTLDHTIVGQPQHGSVSKPDGSGHAIYTPAAGYTGPDSFTFKATDPKGAVSNTAKMSLTVGAAGQRAPSCEDDRDGLAVAYETAKEVTLDCSDLNAGGTLSYSVVEEPEHGSVSAPDPSGHVTYTPDRGYSGPDSFTFKAADGQGFASNTARLALNVAPAGDTAPSCQAQIGVAVDYEKAKPLALRCTDPDEGDRIAYELLDQPEHGSLLAPAAPTNIDFNRTLIAVACPSASQCTAVDGSGHQVTFDPTAPGTPRPTTLDEGRHLHAVACPSITQCTAVDDAGYQVTFDPRAPGSPTPTLLLKRHQLYGVACPSTRQCTAIDNADREVTFDPTAPGKPVPYNLEKEGDDLTAVACPSTRQCTTLGSVWTFDPLEPDPAFRVDTRFFGHARGLACPSVHQCTAVEAQTGHENATIDPPRQITFDPNPPEDLSRPDNPQPVIAEIDAAPNSLLGLACPSTKQCTAVNDAGGMITFVPTQPSAAPTSVTIDEGHALRAVACPMSAQCTAVDDAGNQVTFNPRTGQDPSGRVTYTPEDGYAGRDSFTFRAIDGQDASSEIVRVTLRVAGTGQTPPTCDDHREVAVRHETARDVTLSCSDPDPGATLTYAVVDAPAHGQLSGPDAAGKVTYTPAAGYAGRDSFTFKASDGGRESEVAKVPLNVDVPAPPAPVNAGPGCQDLSGIVAHNTPVQVTLACSDPDAGDSLGYAVVGQPAHGTVSAPDVAGGVTYTPSAGYQGPDSFTFKATDSHGASSGVATATLTVAGPAPATNATPACMDQSDVAVAHNTAKQIALGCSDADATDTLTYAIASQPAHGSLSPLDAAGQVTYTPTAGYSGPDSFTFKASDNHGAAANAATVKLNVAAAATTDPGTADPGTGAGTGDPGAGAGGPGVGTGGGGPGAGTGGAGPGIGVGGDAGPGLGGLPGSSLVLSGLRVSPKVFSAQRSGPPATAAKKRKQGATVSYRLSHPASVTFGVQRRAVGRRVNRGTRVSCARATKRNRGSRGCVRYTRTGTFAAPSAVAGTNKLHFSGRINGSRLRPGRYLLVATPRAADLTGTVAKTTFRIR